MATRDRERYNLLYKPDLRPERDYRSEAVFEEPDIPIGAIVPEETIDDVLQDLKDLEEVSMGLPEGLDFVNEIVTKLRQRAEIITVETGLEILINPPVTPPTTVLPPLPPTVPPGTPSTPTVPPDTPYDLPLPVTVLTSDETVPGSPVDTPTTVTIVQPDTPTSPDDIYTPGTGVSIPAGTYVYEKDPIPPAGTIIIPEEQPFVFIGSNTVDDPYNIPNLPTSFVPSTDITLSIKTPKSLVEIAQESYKKDQIDLQKFYLQKMRMALQRYFHHLLGLTAELGLSNPDMLTKKYDGDSVTGIGANSKHLHDTIVRSQIQRAQKVRLSKKMANADLTMTHMRSWHVAEKERERYYTEAYSNADTFVNSESNALLRQARSDYDAAYKLALYNMYKYLDASVKLTEDILDHTLTEAKAKAKLMKDGVDIFKTKEVTVTKDNNAVQTLKPSTKEEREAQKQSEEQQKAREKAGSKSKETKEEKAKRIDEAKGIKDPDENFELAPSGGHYSKNDIDYLCNSNPEYYSRDTATGRANIMAALNTSEKYVSTESNDNTNSTDQSGQGSTNENDTIASGSAEVSGGPNNKEQGVTETVNLSGDTDAGSANSSVSSVQAESREQVDKATQEESKTSKDSADTTSPTNGDGNSMTNDIQNVLAGTGFMLLGSYSKFRSGKTVCYARIVNVESSLILCGLKKENNVIKVGGTVATSGSSIMTYLEDTWKDKMSQSGYGISLSKPFTADMADTVFAEISSY